MVNLIDRLIDKLVSEWGKSDNGSKPPARQTRTIQAERELLLTELNRSNVFHFKHEKDKGIILYYCNKEHNVKDLTVPDVVDVIGREAFKSCKYLESITIPPSVKIIEDFAFKGCTNLKEVHFSGGLQKIGSQAFDSCGLVDVELPRGLAVLSDRVFYNCTKLKKVMVPESIHSFQNGVFYGCESLEEVLLQMKMRGTFCNVFAHCKSLEHIVIPEGVREIEDWCFEYCDNLKDVCIPNTVTKICNRAFLYCKSLKKINIPDSVNEIEVAAVFAGCSALESVRLPIGIRFTPRYEKDFDKVFYNCNSLKTVVLGSHTFQVDEPPDENALIYMHTSLAVEGNPSARDYIYGHFDEVFRVIVDRGDIGLTDKLLASKFASAKRISSETVDKAIDYAAEKGEHEIYLMLVKFKQEKLGFDSVKDRFEL